MKLIKLNGCHNTFKCSRMIHKYTTYMIKIYVHALHQNEGQDLKISNKYSENVAKLKYLGMTITKLYSQRN
jgi:hypothetical protein